MTAADAPRDPAGEAIEAALDALIRAERAVWELDHDERERVGAWTIDEAVADRHAARAAVLAAIDAAEQAAWRAGLDVGVARGRAAALREVDEALEQIATDGGNDGTTPSYSSFLVNVERQAWADGQKLWGVEDALIFHTSPTAAILAAAAALAEVGE